MTSSEKKKLGLERKEARRRLSKEKEDAVTMMMKKHNFTKKEVVKIWDEFFSKHPDGLMSKQSFLETKEVRD